MTQARDFGRYLSLLSCLLLTTSCATAAKVSFQSTDPTEPPVKNEVQIPEPVDVVWDRMVKQLSKSFFVVNNISKDSRLINVSFSSNEPDKYIDCGTVVRTYKKGATDETYRYGRAESSTFRYSKQAGSNSYYDYLVSQKTSLEGRINIYVAPAASGTTVTVNTRYILTSEQEGTYEVVGGALQIVQQRGVTPRESKTHAFTTNESNHDDWGSPGEPHPITCQSRGTLENEILDMARGGEAASAR
jgi:hypothetical protein